MFLGLGSQLSSTPTGDDRWLRLIVASWLLDVPQRRRAVNRRGHVGKCVCGTRAWTHPEGANHPNESHRALEESSQPGPIRRLQHVLLRRCIIIRVWSHTHTRQHGVLVPLPAPSLSPSCPPLPRRGARVRVILVGGTIETRACDELDALRELLLGVLRALLAPSDLAEVREQKLLILRLHAQQLLQQLHFRDLRARLRPQIVRGDAHREQHAADDGRFGDVDEHAPEEVLLAQLEDALHEQLVHVLRAAERTARVGDRHLHDEVAVGEQHTEQRDEHEHEKERLGLARAPEAHRRLAEVDQLELVDVEGEQELEGDEQHEQRCEQHTEPNQRLVVHEPEAVRFDAEGWRREEQLGKGALALPALAPVLRVEQIAYTPYRALQHDGDEKINHQQPVQLLADQCLPADGRRMGTRQPIRQQHAHDRQLQQEVAQQVDVELRRRLAVVFEPPEQLADVPERTERTVRDDRHVQGGPRPEVVRRAEPHEQRPQAGTDGTDHRQHRQMGRRVERIRPEALPAANDGRRTVPLRQVVAQLVQYRGVLEPGGFRVRDPSHEQTILCVSMFWTVALDSMKLIRYARPMLTETTTNVASERMVMVRKYACGRLYSAVPGTSVNERLLYEP
uniref:Uncharacterized protein n=1 Tax=Anopheles farauti TaxID=69004 RepID=A0A182QZZ9_9DIPT